MITLVPSDLHFSIGVSDGIRTHDIQDHNLALCQLSYAHHRRGRKRRAAPRSIPGSAHQSEPGSLAGRGRLPAPAAPVLLGWPYRAAIARAVAVSGPGGGTNTASR